MPRGDLSSALTVILISLSIFAIAVGIASTYMIYKASRQDIHYIAMHIEDYARFLTSIKNVTCNAKNRICKIVFRNGKEVSIRYGQKMQIDNMLIMCEDGKVYLVHR